MFRFLNKVVRSHLGHVLLAVSWTLILLVYVRPPFMQPQFVDCVPTRDEVYSQVIVDKSYPIWTAAIMALHAPTFALTQIIAKVCQRAFSLSCGPSAKLEVPLLFLFSGIQWPLAGYTMKSLVQRVRSQN